ncbi:MAG: inositol monophosphatase [Candidatus Omnitrophica bacterium]|nr:inositol monophosphatase [Candidatus Omnitrophota bacterium]
MTLDQTIISQTLAITQEAGRLLLEKFETDIEVGIKGKEEIVTEADRASEALLHERLGKVLPDAGFCGEETGVHPGARGLMWVVDPLDGTHNYSVGIPLWGCSVALLDEQRVPLFGVLDFPTLRKTFWAQRGGGAFRDGERIRVDTSPLNETSLVGVQSRIRLDPFPVHVQRTCFKYCGRSLGAIAYHASLIATGRMRACADLTVRLHDIAAAMVIIEEAGGMVSNLDGDPVLPAEHFTGPFEDRVLPFYAGDPVTGPELRRFLFPEGTPPGARLSRGPLTA